MWVEDGVEDGGCCEGSEDRWDEQRVLKSRWAVPVQGLVPVPVLVLEERPGECRCLVEVHARVARERRKTGTPMTRT